MSAFSERLRQLRNEKKIKQEDLAKYLNISRSAYGHYETGHTEPSKDVIEKLAKFFSVTTDYLLGRTDERNISYSEIPVKDSNESLTKYEKQLLEIFRQLEDIEKGRVIQFAIEVLKESQQQTTATSEERYAG